MLCGYFIVCLFVFVNAPSIDLDIFHELAGWRGGVRKLRLIF